MCPLPLELKAALAGAIGERLDAPVIQVSTTIEHHSVDACGFRTLGDELANLRGGLTLWNRTQARLDRRRGGKCLALAVVTDLSVDPGVGTKHRQARTLRSAVDLSTKPLPAPFTTRRRWIDVPHARWPTFRRITSPAYLMPLTL